MRWHIPVTKTKIAGIGVGDELIEQLRNFLEKVKSIFEKIKNQNEVTLENEAYALFSCVACIIFRIAIRTKKNFGMDH